MLAVTRRTVDRVAQKLLDHGYVGRGFLGIALQPVPLPQDLKAKLQLDQDTAIMLLGVEPNGPAATAGLIMGDILLEDGLQRYFGCGSTSRGDRQRDYRRELEFSRAPRRKSSKR